MHSVIAFMQFFFQVIVTDNKFILIWLIQRISLKRFHSHRSFLLDMATCQIFGWHHFVGRTADLLFGPASFLYQHRMKYPFRNLAHQELQSVSSVTAKL